MTLLIGTHNWLILWAQLLRGKGPTGELLDRDGTNVSDTIVALPPKQKPAPAHGLSILKRV
jgi:hypothetical protein